MQDRELKGSEVSTSLFATISLLEVGNDGYLHKTFYDVLGIKITRLWERSFMHRKIFMG